MNYHGDTVAFLRVTAILKNTWQTKYSLTLWRLDDEDDDDDDDKKKKKKKWRV
jgi:hypothetical protein